MDQLKEIVRALQNTLVLLAGAYLLHELIQKLVSPCPDCVRARGIVVSDGEQAGEDTPDHTRDDQDAWPPTRVIRSTPAYAPGAGD